MKKVILLALLMPFMAYGQIIENFETQNLNSWLQGPSGRWSVDTSIALSGGYSLRHSFDNTESGNDHIGLKISDLHPAEGVVTWTFYIRHGYDPSSSNNWAIALCSDTDPSTILTAKPENSYSVGVNLTGYDDTLRLYKNKGGEISQVVNTHINWQNSVGTDDPVKIVAERTPEGQWRLSVFSLNGQLIGGGEGADTWIFSPGWFTISYKYSSTRDRLLWFDDLTIEGVIYADSEAPEILNTELSGRNSIDITLSEAPYDNFLLTDNFHLNTSETQPVEVYNTGQRSYRISFEKNFENKIDNSIKISAICDDAGNCNEDVIVSFLPVWPELGDIVITEIMADPTPVVSLPAKEYIELKNTTDFSYNLFNCELSATDQKYLLPEYELGPLEHVILCPAKDTSLFSEYGRVTGLKQFPTLSDMGRLLVLSDSSGILLHGVEYSSRWYNDELKAGGGWSLEMIDENYPFYYEGNWRASNSRTGGSPGAKNSVARSNPDNLFFGVTNVFPIDSESFSIDFSEPQFTINDRPELITVEHYPCKTVTPSDPLFRSFIVKIEDLPESGGIYELVISGELRDYSGNSIVSPSFMFGFPETAEEGDILFNELLFNPFPGEADYIELYNSSEKTIDASRLQMASVNDEAADTSGLFSVSDYQRVILPHSYHTLTTDRASVMRRYFSAVPDAVFELTSLPSMADNSGHIILLNRELDKLDEVRYSEEMHYSLLSDYEGVALEKVSTDSKSADPENWHSASEVSGWGTPGGPNSVLFDLAVQKDAVELSSSKISPDNDGIDDILRISFSFSGNGNVVSVNVFNETGTYIRNLASNLLVGPQASLTWDGTADDMTLVRTGIYILMIRTYDDTGKMRQWKKVCTVVR